MRSKYNELAIGLTVTIATLIVIGGIMVLSRSNFFVTGMRIEMYVVNAEGLGVGDDVTYRGIVAGSVQSIKLERRGVLVDIKLNGTPDIPADSRFTIKDASLIGGKLVEIKAGSSSTYLRSSDRVTGRSEGGITTLDTTAFQGQFGQILANINNLSGEATLKNLYSLIENLNASALEVQGILSDNRAALAATMTSLQGMSAEDREPIAQTVSSINRTSDDLAAAIQKMSVSLDKVDAILDDLKDGKGTLGKLLVDDTLYVQLTESTQEFKSLIDDIKKNPRKYVTVKIF